MKNKHIYINVFLSGVGFESCGVITYNPLSENAVFSYFEEYITKEYPPINPATLNYRKSQSRHFIVDRNINNELLDKTFWELIPNENDWGDHVLSAEYEEYDKLNKVEKLFFLNTRQVGGLESYSVEPEVESSIDSINFLDRVRDDSINFYLRNIEKIRYIKSIKPLTGYGGIRPKCMFEDEKGEFWIAKFNTPNDSHDMVKFEKTTLDMARDSGLRTTDTKILMLPSGHEAFLSKRFDRDEDRRFHSLSFFALMDKNDMVKGNYQGNPGSYVKQLIDKYSDFKDHDTLRLVQKYLIDIAFNNTDNHLRNIRLILNNEHKWELSPNFDIVANQYEQSHIYNPLEINSEELYLLNPNLPELFEKKYSIDKKIINENIDRIIGVMENWEEYCDKNNMSEEDKVKFCNALNIGLYKKHNKILKPKSKIEIVNKKESSKPKPLKKQV